MRISTVRSHFLRCYWTLNDAANSPWFLIPTIYTFRLTPIGFTLRGLTGKRPSQKLVTLTPAVWRCATVLTSIVVQLWGLVAARCVWQELRWRMCTDTCCTGAAEGQRARKLRVLEDSSHQLLHHKTFLSISFCCTCSPVTARGFDLELPKSEFVEQAHRLVPLATQSGFTSDIYPSNNSCKAATSVWRARTSETTPSDWLFSFVVIPVWMLLCGFSREDFPKIERGWCIHRGVCSSSSSEWEQQISTL